MGFGEAMADILSGVPWLSMRGYRGHPLIGHGVFSGAPRILQSLAVGRIFPILLPFSKGVGPANKPRRGVLLSAGIAFITVALGKLNVIASVVSMFFLISYGLLNYATFFEA